MPNRIIKESICESEGLSKCSMFSQDLYKRLITYADDYGRFNSDTEIMRARLYPRELDIVTEEDIIDGLCELAGNGKVSFYTPRVFNQFGKKGIYGVFPNWENHERKRNTSSKCPAPDDTEINDWYLRRFIPMDMKVEIVNRDKFRCQICGKYLTSCRDAKRFLKLGTGLYNIDHIVPVLQGGRATEENLRLTCPECNKSRKRKFNFQEILDITNGSDLYVENTESSKPDVTCGELRRTAASCGEPRRVAAEKESSKEKVLFNNNTITAFNTKALKPKESTVQDILNTVIDEELRKALSDFSDNRKELKKPMTGRAMYLAVKKLNELSSDPKEQIEIVNQSIMNGWQGLFALKKDKTENNSYVDAVKHRMDDMKDW